MNIFFFNSDSHHTRLNNHYEAGSSKKKKFKMMKAYRKTQKESTNKRSLLLLDVKQFRQKIKGMLDSEKMPPFLVQNTCLLFMISSSSVNVWKILKNTPVVEPLQYEITTVNSQSSTQMDSTSNILFRSFRKFPKQHF